MNGPAPLCIFDGIMDALAMYVNILDTTLLPFIAQKFPSSHRFMAAHRFMADNDPQHKSKLSQQFLEKQVNFVSSCKVDSSVTAVLSIHLRHSTLSSTAALSLRTSPFFNFTVLKAFESPDLFERTVPHAPKPSSNNVAKSCGEE